MSEISEIEIKSMTKEQNYMRGYENGKFDVLEKIRAELHATAEMHEDGVYYLRDEWIDEIIDKHKTESENKEGENA